MSGWTNQTARATKDEAVLRNHKQGPFRKKNHHAVYVTALIRWLVIVWDAPAGFRKYPLREPLCAQGITEKFYRMFWDI